MKNLVSLMLDSGVFSAWNRGEELDVYDYIDYLHKHAKYLFSYVAMDCVPDASDRKKGTRPTSVECQRSAKASYDNLQIMKKEGLAPIPVFHQGEPFYWLERMVDDGEDYIGISPWKRNITVEQQQEWFDRVFSMLTDREGRPLIKTHGFGVTSHSHLVRYPFYSVDSTTWSLNAGYGTILLPPLKGGQFDFRQPPMRMVVGGVQHSGWSAHTARQVGNMEPVKRPTKRQIEIYSDQYTEETDHWKTAKRWLDHCGLTFNGVRYSSDLRREAMLVYFRGLTEHLRDVRFEHRQGSLLTDIHSVNRKPIKIPQLRIMYATTLLKNWSEMLTRLKANTRLLSYYELRKQPEEVLAAYVKRGIVGKYKRRPPKIDWNSTEYRNYRMLMTHTYHNELLEREDEL